MAARRVCRHLPQYFAEGWLGSHSVVGRGISSSSVTSCSASRAPPVGTSGSFLSWLSKDGVTSAGRISVPLSQPLHGLSVKEPYTVPSEPPPTEITVLPNGARIVSEASSGPIASLGIYINSGSIYESTYDSGSTALLECLAFKATKHRTTTRVMKEIEKVGSTVLANVSREQMAYTIDCLKTSVPEGLELLADAVLNPRFNASEVDEQKERLKMLLGNKDVQMTLLNELLIRKAYSGALSHPLIPDLEQLPRLSSSVLHDFVSRNYTAPRLVLAAAGVNHQELVRLATPMLEQLPSGAGPSTSSSSSTSTSSSGSGSGGEVSGSPADPTSEYTGAFVHLPGSFPQANLVLAFEYRGGWRDVQGAVIMTVLTYLMGGGNSFSSGGPGKGMHSRLYTRVLNQYGWVHSCSAFNSTFNGTGLVGVQAACDPPHVHDMLNIMCGELDAVTRSISQTELERAKCAAISVICNALESKATSAEDIGRQLLTYGHRISGRQYVELIRAVTAEQVQDFAAALMRSRPSLAAYGDKTEEVSYENVLSRFQAGPAPAKKSRGLGRLWRSSSS